MRRTGGQFRMRTILKRAFLISAALVLIATASAKIYSAFGDVRLLEHVDGLFSIRNRWLLIGVSALELALVYLLVRTRIDRIKFLALIWLATMFGFYRFANWYFQIPEPCPCLGTLAQRLGWSPTAVEGGLTITISYLFTGSLIFLLSDLFIPSAERNTK
jgi:hypothetical protein